MTEQPDGKYAAIASRYPLPEPMRIEREESGMNNTTRMIYAGKQRCVLRVYDNHRDHGIVNIEHAILSALQRAGLSFGVPNPIANLAGETVTETADGKLAAMFGYMAGTRPSIGMPSHVEGMGRAAGELTRKLAEWMPSVPVAPAYKPYYELEATHAAVDADTVGTLCANHPLTAEQLAKVGRLLAKRHELTALTDRFKQLPHQWIHGDIVFSNALAAGDAIVGLLDFEFCTVDVRAMEMAVMLAEFPDEDDASALERIALLTRGYGTQLRLDREEIELLPELIQLRMVDVWLHFAGRLAEGLDPAEVWTEQIERVSFVCEWVGRNRERLLTAFRAMEKQGSTV